MLEALQAATVAILGQGGICDSHAQLFGTVAGPAASPMLLMRWCAWIEGVGELRVWYKSGSVSCDRVKEQQVVLFSQCRETLITH